MASVVPFEQIRKVALFLPNWVGDVVMATPAIRAIRRHYARPVELIAVCRPKMRELLAGTDWIDKWLPFDPRSKRRELSQRTLIRTLRREKVDLAVLFTNSLRTAILAWLAGIRYRVGYVRDGRGWLLTGRLYPLRDGGKIIPQPMVYWYLRLAYAVGCPCESPRLELVCTDQERKLGERIWRELGLRDGRVVAFNCGSATSPARLWPAERFAALAHRIATELDYDVLVLCGPQERDVARFIVQQVKHPRVFSVADQPLGLATPKACLSRCTLLVTTDSGPRHIAAALGIPVVTLFGPTPTIWVENPTVRAAHVKLDLDCIGCSKKICPLKHHRCMQELTVEYVYQHVVNMLQQAAVVTA